MNTARLAGSLDWMAVELAELADQGRRRHLRQARALPGGKVELDGRILLNLCSNNYLGIMEELEAPSEAAGATASRLIVGNHPAIIELEEMLAELHQTEAALVFGSGYLANLGCLTALASRGDAIYADKLNHASLIDGAELSRATHVRYRHNDLDHLESLLKQGASYRRKLIVSDAVFSMDGDCAEVAGLVELKDRYGAMLMLDEAHSGGVLGPGGAGLSAAHGLAEHVDVHMGTLSKAFGCYGAYVAGKRPLIDYLVNRARSLIYSSGLPPLLAKVAQQAVGRVRQADERRRQLHQNAELFRQDLWKLGLDTGSSTTQIIPLITGADETAVELGRRLRKAGVGVLAIRPPTVRENAARIRFSIMATHQPEDLRRALAAIAETCRGLNLPKGSRT